MSTAQTWVADFTAREQGLAGANVPWLAAMRKRAIERFADEGWPTPKQESWRHTSLAMMEQQSFLPAADASAAALVQALRQGEPGHWLVFTDGKFNAELSDIGALPAGAKVRALSQALVDSPDQVQDGFGTELQGSSIAALNLALVSDGAFIRLERGVVVEQPIHLVFVAVSDQAASFPRSLIHAESGAQANIIEHYVGQGSSVTLTNTVTRANLASDAHVTHVKLQQENQQAFHFGTLDVEQGKGSIFNSHSMSFGARLARHDITTTFSGQHCETLLNGLYYVDGRRHVDHHTVIGHAQPKGISREYYRGILADTARGVFGGRILVSPGADGTDAVQRSDSLLLSRMAKADSRPELEIYADDVKCAHGATVGQIDENSLFYLRTRGMDEAHARSIMTYAFAAQALERIEIPLVRARVAQAIRGLLPSGVDIGELA